jgi:ubiquinone/menaquinone biosynthesis C-methylase UbiE
VLVSPIAASNAPAANVLSFVPTRSDRRAEIVAQIIRGHHAGPLHNLLVVGCGTGREAAIVGTMLQARVTGIDLSGDFDESARQVADLRVADAQRLPFPSSSFDFVYSYHALEHFADPKLALFEMARVLRPEGGYFVGTPNRQRAVGYIGGSASFRERVEWNLADYRARLVGRFRNEFGAHAGYSAAELWGMLAVGFGTPPIEVTFEYYVRLYSRRASLIRLLHRTKAGAFAFPSVYFIGRGRISP